MPVYLRISSDSISKLPQIGTKIFYHTTPDFTTGNVSRETFSAFLHDSEVGNTWKLEIFGDVSRETFKKTLFYNDFSRFLRCLKAFWKLFSADFAFFDGFQVIQRCQNIFFLFHTVFIKCFTWNILIFDVFEAQIYGKRYFNRYKALLISCEVAIRLWASSEADCEYPRWLVWCSFLRKSHVIRKENQLMGILLIDTLEIKAVYGCSEVINISFAYKMYFHSPGLCFFIVLPRFFIFQHFFSLCLMSKRHNPRDILFFIFSPFFLFPVRFSMFFSFYRPGCTFSVFYRFIWFHYNFSVFYSFNVFLSLTRLLSSFPSFWLTFLSYQHFLFLLSVFIPHHHFTPFAHLLLTFCCLSLLFFLFSPMSILYFPFSAVFCLFSTHFYLFRLFLPLLSFYTLFFAIFSFPSIFSFLLMSLSQARFSRFTPFKMFHVKHRFLRFSVFGNQWEKICSQLPENHSRFSPLYFLRQSYFLLYFWFSPYFLHFSCIFVCFTRFFVSVFDLLLNYLIIFLYFRINWTFTFVFSDFPKHLLNAF